MKKNRFFILLLAMAVSASAAVCSKGYESQKNAAGLNITLKAEQYPLVKGDNNLSLKLTDSSGKAVTDAKVDVRFYMPPMPGMAPMESMIQPLQKGNEYRFTVNVAMEGGWKIDALAIQPGKTSATATFNIDAR